MALSPKTREALIALYVESGFGILKLAKGFAIHYSSAYRIVKKAGVMRTPAQGNALMRGVERVHRRLTEDEKQIIASLYSKGIGVPTISTSIGRHPTTVYSWLKRNTTMVRGKAEPLVGREAFCLQYIPGQPQAQLAKELGVSLTTVKKYIKDYL